MCVSISITSFMCFSITNSLNANKVNYLCCNVKYFNLDLSLNFLHHLSIKFVFYFTIVYFFYHVVKKIVFLKNYNPTRVYNPVHRFDVLAWLSGFIGLTVYPLVGYVFLVFDLLIVFNIFLDFIFQYCIG
jgi:hypothetical protein